MTLAEEMARKRMARARAACECPSADGIAMCCQVTRLRPFPLLMLGECEPVVLKYGFQCPRHEIMGW